MPSMTLEDFGATPPKNADDIIQATNNLILYREESDFWSLSSDTVDRLERSIIERCARGDRDGLLAYIPLPIY